MVPPALRVAGEDTFDNIGDRAVSEKCGASRIRFTQSRLPAQLKDKVRDQLAAILDVVEETVVRLLGDAGMAMEGRLDIKAVAVIRIVANRSVAKAFQSSVLQSSVERSVQEWLADAHVTYDVAARSTNLPAFTVPGAKFAKNEVEKLSLEIAEVHRHQNDSNKLI